MTPAPLSAVRIIRPMSLVVTSGAAYSNQFVRIFRMRDGSVFEAGAFLDLVACRRAVDGSGPRQP